MYEGNRFPDAFRSGWLMSSHGGPFIQEVQKDKFKPGNHIGPWYVESPGSSCQGLELSLALFLSLKKGN